MFYGANAFCDFDDDVFAFADDEEVYEGGHGFRVEGGGAACEDEGRVVCAVFRAERKSGKVDDREDICVGQFGLHRDSDEVHLVEGVFGFVVEELETSGAEFGFHIKRG